jgi:hypothetical protein
MAEWHAGVADERNAIRLMRRLVSFSPWILEASQEGVRAFLVEGAGIRPSYRQDSEGHRWALLFSDREAYRDYLRQTGRAAEQSGAIVEVDGKAAFGTPLGQVDRIGVNTYSEPHVHYEQAQFVGLRSLIGALEVEEALVRLQGHSSPAATLASLVKRYAAYRVGLRKLGGEHQLVLRSGEDGRELLAAFTFVDCFDRFREDLGSWDAEGELLQVPLTGEKLFTLMLQQRLDGICFNGWGPAPRVWVGPDLAQVVLDAG